MAGVILSEANTSGGPTYDLPGLRNMSVATMSAIVLVVCMCSVLVGLALVRFTSSRLFSVSVRRAVA
jgi:hypothetical protein